MNVNINYSYEQLAKLKRMYAAGVTEAREGDTLIKFSSQSDLMKAIDRIETELGVQRDTRPRGVRRISIGRMN